MRDPDDERLLTPAEVAAMFRVGPKSVSRWARQGKLTEVRTLGGHRRFLASEVEAMLAEGTTRRDTPENGFRDGAGGVV